MKHLYFYIFSSLSSNSFGIKINIYIYIKSLETKYILDPLYFLKIAIQLFKR